MTESTNVLSDREERASFQRRLLERYGHSLVVVRANYPGNQKHTPDTFFVVETMKQYLRSSSNVLHETSTTTSEGRVGYLILDEDPMSLKRRMVDLEESHPFGRLVDIDVLTLTRMYHRSDLGKGMRKCFLCEEIAQVCVRSQRHPFHELFAYYHRSVLEYVETNPREMFRYALLAELSCSPKFGLVTPFTPGSHDDMDARTFIASIDALSPFIEDVVGLETDDPLLFSKLRRIGRSMEEAMFHATHGRNTHKGAIFLFLILITALRINPDRSTLNQTIRTLTEPVKEDFSDEIQPTTVGLRWHRSHGIGGIRGLVVDGMNPVLDDYLPFFTDEMKRTQDMNRAMVKTLLHIMSTLQDTTVLKRGGLDGLSWYQKQASKHIDQDEEAWQTFSEECISRKLSGGGSADVLAIVIYLYLALSKEGNL
ncbi:MAG TPA: citrate lyase holo-[acyl-carrier protein] synthase [Erysipelotrichaceae bacterium]|nr:citrate lyase holo-[acyl-carrier protein] synthase [Erysipelotrichaceae bacterium]